MVIDETQKLNTGEILFVDHTDYVLLHESALKEEVSEVDVSNHHHKVQHLTQEELEEVRE